jgi:hypothetical protein
LLRLPCREDLYENHDVPDSAYFATDKGHLTWQEKDRVGNMAYLVGISSLWGDVLHYLYRKKHRVVSGESGEYEGFYGDKQRQLQAFTKGLPPHLFPCNMQTIEGALQGGYIGTFLSLHTLYHTALMKLNRHAALDELEEGSLDRNLRAAQYHARELLKVIHTLSQLHHGPPITGFERILFTPFQGYAILSAVDILTSVGTLVDLRSDIQLAQSSLYVVQELSKYWASAQEQLKMITVRVEEMMAGLERAPDGDIMFMTTDAMEKTFGREMDLFFSPSLEKRLLALGLGKITEDVPGLLTIESLQSDVRD